jgi:hypothetical protein
LPGDFILDRRSWFGERAARRIAIGISARMWAGHTESRNSRSASAIASSTSWVNQYGRNLQAIDQGRQLVTQALRQGRIERRETQKHGQLLSALSAQPYG